ncbi:MAG: hypothetical protein AAF203_07940, partial [Pseudomonadota bacterium]
REVKERAEGGRWKEDKDVGEGRKGCVTSHRKNKTNVAWMKFPKFSRLPLKHLHYFSSLYFLFIFIYSRMESVTQDKFSIADVLAISCPARYKLQF